MNALTSASYTSGTGHVGPHRKNANNLVSTVLEREGGRGRTAFLHHRCEELGVLVHLVLDVDFLVRVPREGESSVRDDSLVDVGLDLLSAFAHSSVTVRGGREGERTHP